MLKPDKDVQAKQRKYVIVTSVITALLSALLSYVFDTDSFYTHLFYVPIAMSTIWMPKRTILIGFCFAFYHIALELAFNMTVSPRVISRSLIIVIIATMLNEIWKKELSYQKQIKTLTYKNSHDPMTQIYNRGYFDLILESELIYPVTILIIDVDGLKKINDAFGHSVGDEHIMATSHVLHQSLRLGDTLARIGGDEFGIIAQSCGNEGALDIIMRVEKQLDAYNANVETSKWLSLSLGYKVNVGSETIFETMEIADKTMYDNKRRKYEVSNETAKRGL